MHLSKYTSEAYRSFYQPPSPDPSSWGLSILINQLPARVYWQSRHGIYWGGNDRAAQHLGLTCGTQLAGLTDTAAQRRLGCMQVPFKERFRSVLQGQPLHHRHNHANSCDVSHYPLWGRHRVHGVLTVELEGEPSSYDRARHAFLSNIQHDIRTPLAGLIPTLDWLIASETDEEKRKLLSPIKRAADELLDYFNRLLYVVQVASGNLTISMEPMSPKELTESVLTIIRPAAHAKGLDLNVSLASSCPPLVRGDVFRCQQILLNLLGNSIQFTITGSVSLTMRIQSINSTTLLVEWRIRDTGPGLTPDTITQIFDQFYRGTPSYRGTYPGEGLGLFLVKRLVHELNGELEVDGQCNPGSEVICRLPFELPLSREAVPG